MSEATELQVSPADTVGRTAVPASGPPDPTDRPIPLWPEGVLALAAGVTLIVIGLRHRMWLQRKSGEAQRALAEFQRQGGLDDLTQVARQAAEMLRGA